MAVKPTFSLPRPSRTLPRYSALRVIGFDTPCIVSTPSRRKRWPRTLRTRRLSNVIVGCWAASKKSALLRWLSRRSFSVEMLAGLERRPRGERGRGRAGSSVMRGVEVAEAPGDSSDAEVAHAEGDLRVCFVDAVGGRGEAAGAKATSSAAAARTVSRRSVSSRIAAAAMRRCPASPCSCPACRVAPAGAGTAHRVCRGARAAGRRARDSAGRGGGPERTHRGGGRRGARADSGRRRAARRARARAHARHHRHALAHRRGRWGRPLVAAAPGRAAARLVRPARTQPVARAAPAASPRPT